jgi:rifampin ADP-ribosylating transferase
VLVHAYADSLRFFELLLDQLPGELHVFAFTQRGHGDADRPASGYRLDDFTADLVAFLDAVGLDEAVIAGQSSGGYVGQRFAIDHPERTIGLVLMGAPLHFRDKPPDLVDRVSALTDPVDPSFVRAFVDGLTAEPLPTDCRDTLVAESCKLPARLWKNVLVGLLEADVPTETGSVTAPTLILWGEQDAVCPRWEQEGLLAAIPDAELIVYADTGHLVAAERPARTAADMAGFVRRLRA